MPVINPKTALLQIRNYVINRKKKTGKKFALYQEPNKKKSGNKSRKKESSSDSLDNNNAYSGLDDGNAYIFAKKESGYLCAYLNRKN